MAIRRLRRARSGRPGQTAKELCRIGFTCAGFCRKPARLLSLHYRDETGAPIKPKAYRLRCWTKSWSRPACVPSGTIFPKPNRFFYGKKAFAAAVLRARKSPRLLRASHLETRVPFEWRAIRGGYFRLRGDPPIGRARGNDNERVARGHAPL